MERVRLRPDVTDADEAARNAKQATGKAGVAWARRRPMHVLATMTSLTPTHPTLRSYSRATPRHWSAGSIGGSTSNLGASDGAITPRAPNIFVMWKAETFRIFGASPSLTPSLFILGREQRRVPAGGGGVDGHHLLGDESLEIIRTASLRSGAGESGAAERLRPDHRADHVAVDIDIAIGEALRDMRGGGVDAGMDAEGEAVAVPCDVVEQRIEPVGVPAHDMQNRPEHL